MEIAPQCCSGIYNFQSYKLLVSDLNTVPLNGKVLINTISPNSYGLALKDGKTKEALKRSDILILDGLYFGLAPLLLRRMKVRRITGWDAFTFFSKKMDELKGRVFFLGSSSDTLMKIKRRYSAEYPNTAIDYYSPPFAKEFSEQENARIVTAVNAFHPDVLFVAMTAPKQEKWSYENKDRLNAHVICTVGNVFDWYAGNSKRPGKIWIDLGLEWLIRIFLRPEIFRRNIGNQLLFFWHLFLALLRIKAFD